MEKRIKIRLKENTGDENTIIPKQRAKTPTPERQQGNRILPRKESKYVN